MSNNNGSSGGSRGISFMGLLTIVFIILKLCGVISWPWIWVLCPLWIGLVFWVIVFGIILWFMKK